MPTALGPGLIAVPPLHLGQKHGGVFAATPRGASARLQTTPLVSSARRALDKPAVGVLATVSSLGNSPAPWNDRLLTLGRPDSMCADNVVTVDKALRPYNPGGLRARGQLQHALLTQDAASQLRRLDSTLGVSGCRFDYGMRQHVEQALHRQKELATQLSKLNEDGQYNIPKPLPVPERQVSTHDDDAVDFSAQEAHAAMRIQAIHRGRKGRQKAELIRGEAEAQASGEANVYCGQPRRRRR
eukprot:TRINITY_DN21251_c0_g1_i2.p1 TRINITY_DN21251_c0_g1~~TRINITY_DN21251_c0_g1_i2.p1  ORF type:complete len:242 (+),score=34.04 TRINITY_DN21251_c0_g1_i2:109-834(+)